MTEDGHGHHQVIAGSLLLRHAPCTGEAQAELPPLTSPSRLALTNTASIDIHTTDMGLLEIACQAEDFLARGAAERQQACLRSVCQNLANRLEQLGITIFLRRAVGLKQALRTPPHQECRPPPLAAAQNLRHETYPIVEQPASPHFALP